MSTTFGTSELLAAYRRGVFPMADARDDPNLFLIDPDQRGIIPLDNFHVPKRLARTIRQEPFEISVSRAFTQVLEKCAEFAENRESTWINSAIVNLYSRLHRKGFAHSVECWQAGRLVGGLYGVSIGSAFFGESMFSRVRDASKIALVHLAARLIAGGYTLLDAQFHNPHLEQFGMETVQRREFKKRLQKAIKGSANFSPASAPVTGQDALQLITQTS